MFVVINKDGLIHDCETQERYDAFKAAGWEDYKNPPEPEKPSKIKPVKKKQ